MATTRRVSVHKPEYYIGLSHFPNGGDQEVALHISGRPFTLSRVATTATLPSRLTDRDAQQIIAYNEAVEHSASSKTKSRLRRRLPASVRNLLYD